VKLADNAIATYNLVHQFPLLLRASISLTVSHQLWRALNQAANTYGNSQQWMTSATPALAHSSYQQGDHSPICMLPQYGLSQHECPAANRGAGRDQ